MHAPATPSARSAARSRGRVSRMWYRIGPLSLHAPRPREHTLNSLALGQMAFRGARLGYRFVTVSVTMDAAYTGTAPDFFYRVLRGSKSTESCPTWMSNLHDTHINPCFFRRSHKLLREIPNDSAERWMSPS